MVIVTLHHSRVILKAAHNSAQLRCFESGNDDFGVEAFWAIHCAHWSSGFMVLNASISRVLGQRYRVGYFVPLNGPLNGHPPSKLLWLLILNAKYHNPDVPTLFLSHGAFNLNHAVMPPPSPTSPSTLSKQTMHLYCFSLA